MITQKIWNTRWLNAQHQDHWGFLEALKRNVEAGPDFHIILLQVATG
jgi:hypothetical protein